MAAAMTSSWTQCQPEDSEGPGSRHFVFNFPGPCSPSRQRGPKRLPGGHESPVAARRLGPSRAVAALGRPQRRLRLRASGGETRTRLRRRESLCRVESGLVATAGAASRSGPARPARPPASPEVGGGGREGGAERGSRIHGGGTAEPSRRGPTRSGHLPHDTKCAVGGTKSDCSAGPGRPRSGHAAGCPPAASTDAGAQLRPAVAHSGAGCAVARQPGPRPSPPPPPRWPRNRRGRETLKKRHARTGQAALPDAAASAVWNQRSGTSGAEPRRARRANGPTAAAHIQLPRGPPHCAGSASLVPLPWFRSAGGGAAQPRRRTGLLSGSAGAASSSRLESWRRRARPAALAARASAARLAARARGPGAGTLPLRGASGMAPRARATAPSSAAAAGKADGLVEGSAARRRDDARLQGLQGLPRAVVRMASARSAEGGCQDGAVAWAARLLGRRG